MMVELKSIDQLLYFMKGHIHLSRYDEKFIDNISTLSTVTTNQVILLHRLVFKYRRQFIKHELFVEKLVELPWNVTVVESSPQYTDGHVSIVNGMIYFRCPFNRSFIDDFRKVPLNTFVWDKQKRQYETAYNVYSLKILLNVANKFFPNIHVCDITQSLLDEIEPFESVLYWQPTLVERNGNLFIVACNSALDEALGDIKLSADIDTYTKVSTYGINVGSEFYENDERLEFICKYNPVVEQSNLQKLVTWLKDINCDMVYISGVSSINITKKKLIECLQAGEVPFIELNFQVPPLDKKFKCPVLIKLRKNVDNTFDSLKVAKIVTVVNSTPIDIK